ncbi:MAG TPA: hypothetical protein VGY66_32535 [Gemmataceae bacterium]|jgi:hypothetical protein|nr:hypothetical protein [Gemmataceae bacterium]
MVATTARKGNSSRAQDAPEITTRSRPFWIPEGVAFDSYPKGLQRALVAIVQPLYEEEVLAAKSALARASGLSLAHAVWLEIVAAYENGRRIKPENDRDDAIETNQVAINQYLKMAAAKVAFGKFHLQTKKWILENIEDDPLRGRYQDGEETGKN